MQEKGPISWEASDVEARFIPGTKPYWIVFRNSDFSASHGGPSVYIDDKMGKTNWQLGA